MIIFKKKLGIKKSMNPLLDLDLDFLTKQESKETIYKKKANTQIMHTTLITILIENIFLSYN